MRCAPRARRSGGASICGRPNAIAASAALQPATYPLINAATLSLLSGDRAQAEEIAREVLERIAREPDEPETPYYRAATEAEALLLLGRRDEARDGARGGGGGGAAGLGGPCLDAPAVPRSSRRCSAATPAGSTCCGRRARSIMRGRSGGGADRTRRSPRSLEADIGFGFGALAAGAELAAAEALLARGAELHVILPVGRRRASPRASSIRTASAWRARFDAALAAAESVRCVRPLDAPPDARMVALADRIARGAALLNAERLMGEARLHVGRRAADGRSAASRACPALALLAIRVGGGGDAGFEDRLGEVRDALARPAAPRSRRISAARHPDRLCRLPAAAAAAARAIHAAAARPACRCRSPAITG